MQYFDMKKQKIVWPYGNNKKKLKIWMLFLIAVTGAVLLTACVYSCSLYYSRPSEGYISSQTFYDDPNFSYSIGDVIENWDEKRAGWLKNHPSYVDATGNRVLLVTGSQPSPCKSVFGDYFLLRFFKNKVDYCRIHGYDIFYNNAFLHPKLDKLWAKPAAIRAAMIAHPEAEWIWWVDVDAVITNMEFKIPLDKYKNHNIILDGLPHEIFEKRSWLGINSGVVLFRNCQWTMDFLNALAAMGPISPDFVEWGQIFKSTFTDKTEPKSTDQSAIGYMLLEQYDKWGSKIYLEDEYCFQCYWVMALNWFKNATNTYAYIEKNASGLRKRHAELETRNSGELREKYLKKGGYEKKTGRRPFITHFTGCSPCSGKHNPIYDGDSCREGIEKALNFADNQVLSNFGFVRHDLSTASSPVSTI